jgi:putative transposase
VEKENKKLQEDILKYIMKVIKSMVPLKFVKKLMKQGYETISIKRVQRHMKKLGIRSIVVKKYRPHRPKRYMNKVKTY